MSNPSSIFDFVNEDLAAFLATATTDASGTQADVFDTLKSDAPGQEANAAAIQTVGGQLLSNGVDDFVKSSYPFIRIAATGIFPGDVTLDSPSPTLTVGDGTNEPHIDIDKAAGELGSLRFLDAGVVTFQVFADAFGRMVLARSGGAAMLLFPQSTGRAEFQVDAMLDSASPTFTIGDATGSPVQVINKSETGTGALIFRKLGGQSWAFTNNASENMVLAKGAGATVLEISQSTGKGLWAADWELNSASPTYTTGNGTGSPNFILDKSETGTSSFVFDKMGTQSWQFVHDVAEDLIIERAGGVDVLALSQSDGLATFANDVAQRRPIASQGTTLVAGDVALSAGWGATATVSAIKGTDAAGFIEVTPGGAGLAANATITLTFTDGAWSVEPSAMVSRNDFTVPTAAASNTKWTTTTTTLVITADMVPTGAVVYRYDFQCIGL